MPSPAELSLPTVWLNGRLYADPEEARLAVTDHAVVVGDGVFEALKVTEDGAFAVTRHLRRLTRSARALGIPEPDHARVREGIEAVLDGRAYPYGKVRITYTAGVGPLGSRAAYGPPNLIVAAAAADAPAAEATVVTAPWCRNERGALTGVKSTSYAENVRILAHACGHEATEAILLNTVGDVCEGTGSNVFLVFGSELVTPPLSAGPLAGITRELLLEWCPVSERNVTLTEALRADEVFLASSLRDVQPVRRWDGVDFDVPGPHTALVAKIFAERAADDVDP